MKKKKHNYEISIPNQPRSGFCHSNGEPNNAPLKDEYKKKERFERLNALKNKHPKK